MQLRNVGMFVKDLEGARHFFEDYFGATLWKPYNEEENGYYSYIMNLGDGAMLELMTKPQIVDLPKDPSRTGYVHICIQVDDKAALDRVIAKFKEDGYRILYEPATTGGREVRAITFEDLILEVNYPASA